MCTSVASADMYFAFKQAKCVLVRIYVYHACICVTPLLYVPAYLMKQVAGTRLPRAQSKLRRTVPL